MTDSDTTPEPSEGDGSGKGGEPAAFAAPPDQPPPPSVGRLAPRRRLICRRRARWSLTGILALGLAVAGWRAINSISYVPPLTDSGVFASVALHLLEGKVLYRDAWDNKQPTIFVLDALAMAMGGRNINAIRTMERLFDVARVLLVFTILLMVFERIWAPLIAALLLIPLFHAKQVFQWGNLTEEYASVFSLAGMVLVLIARRGKARRAPALSFCAGLLFSLAAFTKETFLLSCVPWFCYLLATRPWQWKQSLKTAAFFIAGALVPPMIYAAYFAGHHALGDWADLFSYNVAYAALNAKSHGVVAKILTNAPPFREKVLTGSATAEAAFWIGLVYCLYVPFLRRFRYFPLIAAATFALDYCATAISERQLGHYYMQLVPSFVLVAGMGMAMTASLFEKFRAWRLGVMLAWLGILAFADGRLCVGEFKELALPARQARIDDISKYIIAHSKKDDLLWVTWIHKSKYYLETGRLSPTNHVAPHSLHFIKTRASTADEKLKAVRADLERNPPKFIVFVEIPYLDRAGIAAWIRSHYTRLPVADGSLYVRRPEGSR